MKVPAMFLLLALAFAACGGGSDGSDAPAGPARSGRELFETRILGPNPGCITCHSRDPETTLVGPSIAGVAGRAASRVPNLAAAGYLRQSIVEPSAFVVEGYRDGVMPSDWATVLSDADLEALVAYLLTLN